MKKEIITAIAGMALIAGCTKEAQPTPTQAVTFGIASITSGSMDTRATAAEQKTVQEGSFRVAFAQWQEGE